MKLSLKFASLLALVTLLVFSSCSNKVVKTLSKGSYVVKSGGSADNGAPLIKIGDTPYKAAVKIDFKEFHFAGMMAVAKSGERYNIVGLAPFGVTLFSFTLSREEFIVNHILPQMERKGLLKLMQRDLEILFIGSDKCRYKSENENYIKYKRGGVIKSLFLVNKELSPAQDDIIIAHPPLSLVLMINEL